MYGAYVVENKTEYMFMVFTITTFLDSEYKFCSGVAIKHNVVLTAASCFYQLNLTLAKPDQVKMLWRDGETIKNSVAKSLIPYGKVFPNKQHDIGLIVTIEQVPQTNSVGGFSSTGRNCFVLSYGIYYNDGLGGPVILQKIQVPILSDSDCGKLIDWNGICGTFSGKDGPCIGDQGGPLICNGLVAGILSRGGVENPNFSNCGSDQVKTVFFEDTKLVKDWIFQYAGVKYKNSASCISTCVYYLTLQVAFIL